MATLFLIVGLPGAGKTTRAMQLATEHAALRLTPDEWMIPLFGEPEAGGRRDVLEGLLIGLALDALGLNMSVVLDFGLWGRNERSALRWLADSVGASSQVVYVAVGRATQLDRIRNRWTRTPELTFPMSEADVDRWQAQFEVPDAAELASEFLAAAPPQWPSWQDWAADRWPPRRPPD